MLKKTKSNIVKEITIKKNKKECNWIKVKNIKESIWENYECEGQLNITDFPEIMP